MIRKVAVGAGLVVATCFTLMVACFFVLVSILGSDAGAACKTQASPSTIGTAPLNTPLFQAIAIDTKGNPDLALAMFMGSHLESGWKNTASDGAAYGPYQIQYPSDAPRPPSVKKAVHPDITIAQAENPAYATNYMLQAYKNGLRTVDPILWRGGAENWAKAGEIAAKAAEHPTQSYYASRGAQVVKAAYDESIVAMKSVGIPTILLTLPDPGSGTSPTDPTNPTVPSECLATDSPVVAGGPQAQIVLKAAESQLGVPYVYGAETPRSSTFEGAFDCSGLTIWAFHQAGITLPRVARDQWKATKAHQVTGKQVQAGDLVFFAGSDGTMTEPGHVGIVVDPVKGIMIEAPHTGEVVKYANYAGQSDLIGITDPYPAAPAPTITPTISNIVPIPTHS